MKYTKFTIKNFKGIKDTLVFDFNNLPKTNIFTLVGLNESGKTSILQALDLLLNDCKIENAHTMIHKSKKGNFNDTISINAELELEDSDEIKISEYCKKEIDFIIKGKISKISISKNYVFKNSNCKKIISKYYVDLKGKRGKSKKIVNLEVDNKWQWNLVVKHIKNYFPKIIYYENFLFDFPQKIYLETLPNVTYDKNKIAYREVFQDILDSFNDGLTIEEHILKRIKESTEANKEALDSLLGDISSKMTTVIFGVWSDIFRKTSKEIELKIDKDNQKGYYIELKIKQGKDRYYINERSLGFRWFFSFLLFTEFRKERKHDFGETLFLLDEPASNLSEKSQSKLLSVFETISKKCKIIYSTHQAHLINPKYLAGTYIVKNHAINYDNEEEFNQEKTEIIAILYKHFVSKYPNETDHFKPIQDAIDFMRAEIDLVENMICFEGKNDYNTFMYFQKNYTDFEFKMYPGSGVCKYGDLFRLYTAWEKKVIGIFDSDKEGVKQKKKYIKEISPDLNVFTLNDIDENWSNRSTEDLFIESDKLEIIKYLFPQEKNYNKSKFNTAVEDLYINNKKLDLSEETLNNLKKVFKFIEKKLNN